MNYFEEIVSILQRKGIRYKKKYGQWIRLKIKENRWLLYDTFTRVLSLESDHWDYSYSEGFGGQVIFYFGCREFLYPGSSRLLKIIVNGLNDRKGN